MEVRLSGYELYGCSFCETGGGGHLAVVILVQVVHELHTHLLIVCCCNLFSREFVVV